MSLRSWFAGRRTRKVTRYLTAHPTVAMDVLRQAPALAAAAVRTEVDLAAMANLQRQSLAYPILTQMGYGGKHPLSSALPKPTAFNLRRWSEYPPARRAINAICNPLLDLPWQIVPTEERLEEVPVDKLPGELRQRIMRATAMLQRPNNQDSWRVWLEQVLEDICVGGYGAVEIGIVGKDVDDEPRPAFLWPVDGQTIRINVEWDEQPQTIRYTQSYGYVGLTVATHDPVAFRDDQLLYLRLNPRTHTPFGLGYLEVAFNCINAYIGAFDFAQRKASNATPNFLIFLGENTDIPTTRQWSQYWQQMIEGYGKAPIIGGGREPKVLDLTGSMSQDPLYLKWQEWIVRQIALAFGLSPMKLGLERDVNKCHDADTEILTLKGWKTQGNITLKDYIATVNPQTHELGYTKPLAIHRYAYNGQMIRLHNSLTDICVTPNHRMWIGKVGTSGIYEPLHMIDAEDLLTLKPQFYEQKTVCSPSRRWQQRATRHVTIPDVAYARRHADVARGFRIPREQWLQFVGYYVSEGSLVRSKDVRGSRGVYRCQLSQKTGPTADTIRTVLYAFPIPVIESYDAPTQMVQWHIQNKALYMHLLRTCGVGALGKKLPHWIKMLPPSELQIVFDALMAGDGTWRREKETWTHGLYTTASKQLADDVQEIAFKLGYRTQIAVHGWKRQPTHHLRLYRVMVSKRPVALYYAKNVHLVPYSGTVWCVEVPPHGLFVTRRNGKIAIHGNSTAETMAIEDWETVAPVAQTVADGLNTHLFDHVLGWDDIRFKWIIHTTDTLRQSEVLRNRYESDSMTIDEQRQSWGDPPLPNGRGQWTRTEFEAMHDPRRMTPLPALGEEDEDVDDAPPGLSESDDEDAAT